jgi:hypothetical protein
MLNILSTLISRVAEIFSKATIKRAFAFMFASLVLASTFAPAKALAAQPSKFVNSNTTDMLDDAESDRPKTTREWRAEARETEDQPLERTKRIVEETADAIQDWAEVYPDVAERTVPALKDNNNS